MYENLIYELPLLFLSEEQIKNKKIKIFFSDDLLITEARSNVELQYSMQFRNNAIQTTSHVVKRDCKFNLK